MRRGATSKVDAKLPGWNPSGEDLEKIVEADYDGDIIRVVVEKG